MSIIINPANVPNISAADSALLRDQIAQGHGCQILPSAAGPVLEAIPAVHPDFRKRAEARAHADMLTVGCIRLTAEEIEWERTEGAPAIIRALRGATDADVSATLHQLVTGAALDSIADGVQWARTTAGKHSTTAARLLARCEHHGILAHLAKHGWL